MSHSWAVWSKTSVESFCFSITLPSASKLFNPCSSSDFKTVASGKWGSVLPYSCLSRKRKNNLSHNQGWRVVSAHQTHWTCLSHRNVLNTSLIAAKFHVFIGFFRLKIHSWCQLPLVCVALGGSGEKERKVPEQNQDSIRRKEGEKGMLSNQLTPSTTI